MNTAIVVSVAITAAAVIAFLTLAYSHRESMRQGYKLSISAKFEKQYAPKDQRSVAAEQSPAKPSLRDAGAA